MNLYFLLLVFVIIPLGIPILMFWKKRERVWLSPIFVFVLSITASIILEPRIIDIFHVVFLSGYTDASSTRTALTILFLPVLISVLCVIICKAIEHKNSTLMKSRGVHL